MKLDLFSFFLLGRIQKVSLEKQWVEVLITDDNSVDESPQVSFEWTRALDIESDKDIEAMISELYFTLYIL